MRETSVGTAVMPRMMGSFINQKKNALRCPEDSDLSGKLVAVTGATNGIGLETTRGLLAMGAEVLMMVRNPDKAMQVQRTFDRPEGVSVMPIDLSDLTTLDNGLKVLNQALGDRQIDVLIENAGLSPMKYDETRQGYEIAFGTNVLGHHALRKMLLKHEKLKPDARVVIVTGDIYIMASDCTSDYQYRTPIGAVQAYSRSKLGNFWIGKMLRERCPDLVVTLVHPGVVDSGLIVGDAPIEKFMKRSLLSTPLGAQTSLYCASQLVENGGYYHNTRGIVRLADGDPALNVSRARQVWDECEALASPFIPA